MGAGGVCGGWGEGCRVCVTGDGRAGGKTDVVPVKQTWSDRVTISRSHVGFFISLCLYS